MLALYLRTNIVVRNIIPVLSTQYKYITKTITNYKLNVIQEITFQTHKANTEVVVGFKKTHFLPSLILEIQYKQPNILSEATFMPINCSNEIVDENE